MASVPWGCGHVPTFTVAKLVEVLKGTASVVTEGISSFLAGARPSEAEPCEAWIVEKIGLVHQVKTLTKDAALDSLSTLWRALIAGWPNPGEGQHGGQCVIIPNSNGPMLRHQLEGTVHHHLGWRFCSTFKKYFIASRANIL